MAIFDSDNHRLIVRIIYDGTVMAGKTTNLRQLCNFFTLMRRSELYTPEALNERTLFFDWLHIDGGLVCGHPLRCQLITAPGHLVLARRRALLLTKADTIVFVCDSTPEGVQEGRKRLDRLRSYLQSHSAQHIPIVVQANKQDVIDALSPTQIAQALDLDDRVPIIPARAQEGIGVRETVVLAIRAAANRTQQFILEHGIVALEGKPESEHDLYRTLQKIDPLPLSRSLDDLLTHNSATDEGAPADAVGAVLSQAAADPSDSGQTIGSIAIAEPKTAAPFSLPPVEPLRVASDESADSEVDPSTLAADRRMAHPSDKSHNLTMASESLSPPMLQENIQSGFIWPAAIGRDIIRMVRAERLNLRHDLIGQSGSQVGSGTSDLFIYQAGNWCLKTSLRRRFRDVEEGRSHLIRLARAKAMLGKFLLHNTVLALQQDGEQSFWLWTIAPWVKPLRLDMAEADQAGDERALGNALTEFARAAVAAMLLASHSELVLDVHPSNLALVDKQVVYLDDDFHSGQALPMIGYALLQRVDEYAHWSRAIDRYVEALEEEMLARLTSEDVTRLGLQSAFEQVLVRSSEAQVIKRELTRFALRCQSQPVSV